jgi:hypothetical protein
MRKLAVNTFMSLDGVVQAPGGPDEDPTGGFTYGGWGVNYFDEEMMGQVAEADPYELLLGRGTYPGGARAAPTPRGGLATADQHGQDRQVRLPSPRGATGGRLGDVRPGGGLGSACSGTWHTTSKQPVELDTSSARGCAQARSRNAPASQVSLSGLTTL